MKVVISAQAQRDFAAQVRWLHEHSPQAGRRAAMRIVEVLDLLAEFPDLGREVGANLRDKQVQFGRDGFVIRYRRTIDQVVVLRIFHGRQDQT